jgi:glutathione S-transferase
VGAVGRIAAGDAGAERSTGVAGRASPPCTLITIPISHYCEKARWALDRAGVAYRERAHLQVLHWVAVRRAGGGRTVPVLVCGDRVLAESADIVAYADSWGAGLRSADPEVRALAEELDVRLGPSGRAWMYDSMRGETALVARYGPTGVPAWQRRALPLAFPLVGRVIDRYLDITPASAAASLEEVRSVFDSVAARLGGGGSGARYLVGDSFSAADLTFAALSAAVLMPPGYGVPLPQPDELPARMAAVVRELRAHPAGAHALEMYRTERAARPGEGSLRHPAV